ncbi:MAG: hypothetical protein AAB426_07445 [Myxococcota bacterium]
MLRRAWLLGLASVGCGQSLETPKVVRDLRVLSISVQPPEILYDATVVDSPAPERVATFSALVLNPTGEPLSYRWSYCPVESDYACNDYVTLRDDAPAEYQDGLDAQRAQVESGMAAPLPRTDGVAPSTWWQYDIPDFTPTISSNGAKYFLREDNAWALLTGAWPSVILDVEVESGAERVTAIKRLVLNLQDPGAVVTQYLDVTVCPPGTTPDDVPGCLPIRERVANSNPTFVGVQYMRGRDIDGAYLDPPAAGLTLAPRESMRLLPILGDGSFDSYQTLRGALQNGAAQIVDAEEEPSVAWYCSAGRLDLATTWPKVTKDLDNVYTAPSELPATTSGMVTLWLVAHDQRAGEAWYSIDIRITRHAGP